VDSPPPAAFSDLDLLAAVTARWNIRAEAIRYVPEGAGSYHWRIGPAGHPQYFVTVDDLDTKPWISHERQATFDGLAVAYQAARALDRAPGLSLAVGPLLAADNSVIVRLSDQYAVSVFPFVQGVPGRWGDTLRPDLRAALIRQLATLHQLAGRLDVRVGIRPLALPERPLLMAALHALGERWQGGPLAEPARRALADHADAVTGWLTELDGLANSLGTATADEQLVLTHGEPHPGNLIMTGEGLRLVDWDTAALARPERDLWMLGDDSAGGFDSYTELTGRSVSPAAVRFYRLAWTLSDIASYTATFRSPHERDSPADQRWDGFLSLLGGATSAPYS
jgi:spectinomycin phosphotransferase